ncbi:ASCH domain-containing protein [Marimonas sp. MJW-29]|uniref:ASCH domain-containing protein n=1 Tax=Sulfitobacter sediminis TaxID=3234186 RepID=A0ABV3RKC5_9RHOB
MISVPDALARFPGSTTFTFDESHELNVRILRLVASGFKTVSCDAVVNYEKRGASLPEPGRVDIALHNNGLPVLAVRTISVDMVRFDEMTEDLVMEQGAFRDLAHWREEIEAQLTEAGVFEPGVMMVVERIEVADRFM